MINDERAKNLSAHHQRESERDTLDLVNPRDITNEDRTQYAADPNVPRADLKWSQASDGTSRYQEIHDE